MDFIDEYRKNLEGLINAYRILLALKEGKKRVKLYDVEGEEQDE